MSFIPFPFTIDTDNSSFEELYVDIKGIGTVIIKVSKEGLNIVAFPLHVVDSEIADLHIPMRLFTE